MNYITYLENIDELQQLKDSGANEVIIGNSNFSRFGKIDLVDLEKFANACSNLGICPIFEWDILMTGPTLEECCYLLKKINLSQFAAIRVQDPGAINYLLKHYPQIKIQLILERGNHNLEGIKAWVTLLGGQLQRIILSAEIPKERLLHYKRELPNIFFEILVLGRILLFYTPRRLLAPVFGDRGATEVTGTSEESPHKGFPIIENHHGTFMFNTKDLCLIENIEEIKEMGMEFLRIDLRFGKPIQLFSEIVNCLKNFKTEDLSEIKTKYNEKLVRGFFSVNKTNVTFKKLKNQKIRRVDDNYLGDVLEVNKGKYLGIMLRNIDLTLNIFDYVLIKTPDGKAIKTKVNSLLNSGLEKLQSARGGQLVLMNHVGGVSIRSAVYLSKA